MNIAVVDDEEAIREQINNFIKKRNPDFNISGFATGEELLAAEKDFDMIFLDIQMEGISGIEVARTFRQSGVDVVLIFITGIKEYVFEAFDVSAFHYLLKPIEEQKFLEVLSRAAEEVRKRKGQKERQIFIRAKNQGYTLSLNNILYIESRGKKVEIHTSDMEDVIASYITMDELERQLRDSFYRCHRGYLVNMAHIARYDSDSIFLSNGEKVYLTRKKHNEFVKAYMWYLQNGGVCCV
ncbi:MAG: LytTR family DNA-binding domain-containing protein [Lachnospiraceae bacterium]|nr:LytTR family DNA-binding domain-containing protein [Lachnospiraceae bacterium]